MPTNHVVPLRTWHCAQAVDMLSLLSLTTTLLIFSIRFTSSELQNLPTFSEFISSHGFQLLTYQTTTSDGYILTVHRVVSPDFQSSGPVEYSKTRKPLIAFHGIICQSPVFFYNSPLVDAPTEDSFCGDNIGFCLVGSGKFDIWVPNARGNGLSNGHRWLDSKVNLSYWNFSWEQIALYDIPAVIELVLRETGHPNLAYLGYSQGAGTLFALLSLRPHLATKIQSFVAWAPAVYFAHARTPLRPILKYYESFYRTASGPFGFTGRWFNRFSNRFCRNDLSNLLCERFLNLIFGPSTNLNVSRLPIYTHFSPSPCSRWQLAHYGQLGVSGTFSRFDYKSEAANWAAYGQPNPPEFPLANIPQNIPTLIIYGPTDWFINSTDVEQLVSELHHLGWINLESHQVQSATWNHFDFLAGIGAGRHVYDRTVAFLSF